MKSKKNASGSAGKINTNMMANRITNESQLVRLHNGQPVTDSLAIANGFKRPHKNVLQSIDKLIEDGTINRLEFKPVGFTDAKGERRRMIELTERSALIAMPFIGGKKSRDGQVRLVDAFLKIRAELENLSSWVESRRKSSGNYVEMCESLQQQRLKLGKTTLPHHYANESKMLNSILFGYHGAIDRSKLSGRDCDLLSRLEFKNGTLISSGLEYEERKRVLQTYLAQITTRQVIRLATRSAKKSEVAHV